MEPSCISVSVTHCESHLVPHTCARHCMLVSNLRSPAHLLHDDCYAVGLRRTSNGLSCPQQRDAALVGSRGDQAGHKEGRDEQGSPVDDPPSLRAVGTSAAKGKNAPELVFNSSFISKPACRLRLYCSIKRIKHFLKLRSNLRKNSRLR